MTDTIRNPKIDSARQAVSDPAVDGVAFTGSADVVLPTITRGIYVAADGDIRLDLIGLPGASGPTTLTFVGLKAGSILPVCATKIYDTGTTVAGIALL